MHLWRVNDKSLRSILCFGLIPICLMYIVIFNDRIVYRRGRDVKDDEQAALLHNYQIQGCNCIVKVKGPIKESKVISSCSEKASLRGLNQKVISFSLYGHIWQYLQWAEMILLQARYLYKGWVVRIYHDADLSTEERCHHECAHDLLDFCNVDSLPDLGNQTSLHAMTWRFLPIGDPSVEVAVFRDLEHELRQREVDAVNEWLNLSKSFHLMRDMVAFKAPIMGGYWGFANSIDSTLTQKVRHIVLNNGSSPRYGADCNQKFGDQDLLSDLVYPLVGKNVIHHASFNCKHFKHTRPFPSRLISTLPKSRKELRQKKKHFIPCPEECRPEEHRDWEYC